MKFNSFFLLEGVLTFKLTLYIYVDKEPSIYDKVQKMNAEMILM